MPPTTPPDGQRRDKQGDSSDAAPNDLDAWQTVVHVDRWRAGDSEAFNTLHRRFAPLLRARIRRHRVWPLLEPQMQDDDVVQEIWARAIPAAQENFVGARPGSFLAFLGKIGDRTMIDLVRSMRATKRGCDVATLHTDWEHHALPRPGQAVVETPTSHARLAEMLRIAREELSDREFEAWKLVELKRFSAEEAGLALRCSGAAVRGILLRSRVKLVARMGRDGQG